MATEGMLRAVIDEYYERDTIMRKALEEIAKQDWVENCLDPQRAARIAEIALEEIKQVGGE